MRQASRQQQRRPASAARQELSELRIYSDPLLKIRATFVGQAPALKATPCPLRLHPRVVVVAGRPDLFTRPQCGTPLPRPAPLLVGSSPSRVDVRCGGACHAHPLVRRIHGEGKPSSCVQENRPQF